MTVIHYVGAKLSAGDSATLGSPDRDLHATIVYSRGWFPYRPAFDLFPMVIVPPFTADVFDTHFGSGIPGVSVVRFLDWELVRRHEELLAAGATSDYPDFKAHITVPEPIEQSVLDCIKWMALTQEYYRTWDDGR